MAKFRVFETVFIFQIKMLVYNMQNIITRTKDVLETGWRAIKKNTVQKKRKLRIFSYRK